MITDLLSCSAAGVVAMTSQSTEDESEFMRYTRSVIGTMTMNMKLAMKIFFIFVLVLFVMGIALFLNPSVGFSPPLPLGL
jgi:hypothetical protein